MRRTALILAALVILGPFGSARALILTEKSPEQKFRKDIAKRLSKYALCVTKAVQKCEATGVTTAVECHADTSVADPPADPKDKFPAAVAKCLSKVNFAKKSPSGGVDLVADYEAIGCPGDTDSNNGNGDQRYADLTAYQSGTAAFARSRIDLIGNLIDGAGCASGSDHADQADLDCVAGEGKKIGILVKGLVKCGNKCENDYKNKAGNGGPTDGPNCHLNGDPAFQACVTAAEAKAVKKGPWDPGVQSTVLPAIMNDTETDDDTYNECDCGAGVGPCP